jgi:outer membrane protein TolC
LKKWTVLLGFLVGGLTSLVSAQTSTSSRLTLSEYLKKAQETNQRYLSVDRGLQAAKRKLTASGLDYEPVLSLQYLKSSDESLPNQLGSKTDLTQQTVSLSKKFQTGTSLTLTGALNAFEYEGATPVAVAGGLDKYTSGNLAISLRQSLWKDFFGRNSQRSLNRESKTYELEYRAADFERRRVNLQFESSFWDYLLAQEDLKLKKENLERASKLEKWTSARVGNGISDQSDLMNSKALISLRTLQYQTAQDELQAQEATLRDTLEMQDSDPLPVLVGDLEKSSSHIEVLAQRTEVLPISSILAQLEAQVKTLVAQEKAESMKPDLSVFGTYASNSFNRESSAALSEIDDGKLAKSVIGVSFSMLLGTGAKGSFLDAAQLEAKASEVKAQKELSSGITNWKEFLRRYQVVKQNVIVLQDIAKYQEARARAERDKFSKGRTVTANVVTAETDAAEASVNLLRARSNLRKLEASSVLYDFYEK